MIYMLIAIAVIFVVLMMKKPNSSKESDEVRPPLDIDSIEALNKKYRPIMDRHLELLEKIGQKYTVARELEGYDSPDMDQVITLCEQDISLVGDILEYSRQYDEIRGRDYKQPMPYEAFKRLSIIYEKRGEYEQAAMVCKRALDMGITRDGTDGGMLGRFARLSKKYIKQTEQ